ncbi:LysR family transcriptional regulator [Thalassospira profundimaris]|uniref:LysR family transcriptional regulator n=1 Tax=Thalassospira profundimaris TaxID=502049 RepID=A0A367XMN1_9PROT|nr:LysR family transcriptional regulator [Thalassospira profundimaris]RCK53992.1 LysR family transcriptional regulator [Thalassospira profundimaris]
MRRKLPPLRALVAFEATARHQSVKDAAEELNVTQSAISHQLRQLEESLGVVLFLRKGRGLSLTKSARQLLPRLTAALDDISGITGEIGPDKGRAIRIGALATPALSILIEELDSLRAVIPDDIPVQFRKIEFDDDLDPLEIDLALQIAPKDLQGPDGWTMELLSPEIYHALVSPQWLAQRGFDRTSVDVAKLEPRDILLIDSDSEQFSQITSWFENTRFALSDCWTFSHHIWALEAAREGHGIVASTDVIARKYVDRGELVMLDFPDFMSSWWYRLLIRPSRERDPAVMAAADWIRQLIGREVYENTDL